MKCQKYSQLKKLSLNTKKKKKDNLTNFKVLCLLKDYEIDSEAVLKISGCKRIVVVTIALLNL